MLAASGRGNTDYFSNDWPGDKKSNFSDFCLDSIGELPRKQNFPFDILKNAKETRQKSLQNNWLPKLTIQGLLNHLQ